MSKASVCWLLLLACTNTQTAQANDKINYESGGHLKTRGTVQAFP